MTCHIEKNLGCLIHLGHFLISVKENDAIVHQFKSFFHQITVRKCALQAVKSKELVGNQLANVHICVVITF